jgi:hypothetical protein
MLPLSAPAAGPAAACHSPQARCGSDGQQHPPAQHVNDTQFTASCLILEQKRMAKGPCQSNHTAYTVHHQTVRHNQRPSLCKLHGDAESNTRAFAVRCVYITQPCAPVSAVQPPMRRW